MYICAPKYLINIIYELTILPDLIQGIKMVESINVLGVIINDQLTTSAVTELIATCARTLYAIRTLKAHGLIGHALHTVFKAIVQARLLYCAPSWSGYCTAAERDCLESFLRCCKRLGYCDIDTQSVVEQFQLADETLSERVLNDDRHPLQSLLPPRTEYSYNLGRGRHDYELIAETRTLNTNNFIMAALHSRCGHYTFVLWFLLSFFLFSSPNLSGRRVDVYHTSTHGVALVQI